jgi:hypothetical protein
MKNCKFILIPSADSIPGTNAKFTKGKRYEGEACNQYSSTTLYRIIDDNGKAYVVNPKDSYYIGGNHFNIEVGFNNVCAQGGFSTGGYVDSIFKDSNIGAGEIKVDPVFGGIVKIEPTIKVKDNDDAADALLNAMIRGGIGWAIDKIKSDNFMREPFSRIAELEKQVDSLTGELNAAHNTIAKVREIMRSEPGYDIQDHARVLRMMADALLKLQK